MGGMVPTKPPHLARHRADQRRGAASANISGRKAAADANERRFGGERSGGRTPALRGSLRLDPATGEGGGEGGRKLTKGEG